MKAIEICPTADLGGHVEGCDECGSIKISCNPCRNRHCPKCQCLDKERWLEAKKRHILRTHYSPAVFTISKELRPIALRNQKKVYRVLFIAVLGTLKVFTEDPKDL